MNNKKYFSISEVSKMLDIEQHVIRFWDKQFDGISSRIGSGSRRYFNDKNIKKLSQVKDLLHQNGKSIHSSGLVRKILDKKNSIKKHDSKNSQKQYIADLDQIVNNLRKIVK